jgi:sporulation protein YlmC with PRC-barrel domain
MSKSKRHLSVAGTAAALAMLASTGAAFAQDTSDKTYQNQATEAHKTESAKDSHTAMSAKSKDEARRMASNFGVSELNDIENWKITNDGKELGEIDRIGVDHNSGELVAVVGLKGVVGVNMKEVAIPLQKLQKAGNETLSTNLTKDELQKKRDIDPWDDTYSQVRHDDATR